MEHVFKLLISVILIIILLELAVPLINNYSHYMQVNSFANDVKGMLEKMNNLKEVSDEGSFLRTVMTVPGGYELVFNNYTNELMILGNEEFNLSVNQDLLNYLELSNGRHELELYHGNLSYEELITKPYLVTFK